MMRGWPSSLPMLMPRPLSQPSGMSIRRLCFSPGQHPGATLRRGWRPGSVHHWRRMRSDCRQLTADLSQRGPCLAAGFGAPWGANGLGLQEMGGGFAAPRPVLGGGVQGDVTFGGDLVRASVGPGAFDPADSDGPSTPVEPLTVDFSAVPERVTVTGI